MDESSLYTAIQIWAFAVALCVGSFINVCIARMPDDRSVASPPSHCPSCGHAIRWYENIPVLSWLALRARCSACGTRISPLYPMIELLVGVLGLLLFRNFIPSIQDFSVATMTAWAIYLVFIAMLVGLSYIDLRHYIIPDPFSIYAVPFGVAASALLTYLGWERAVTWQQSVVGALLGAGALLLIIGAWWLIRRQEGMGYGDVKLLAMLGSFLGALPALFFIVLMSSLLGSAIGIATIVIRRSSLRTQLPFGPFLAAAAIVYLFFGDTLVTHWLPGLALAG